VQGACDLGALPNVYPGYQSVEDAEIHAKFEKAWDAKLSDKTGLTVVEMFHAIEDGNVRALYLMGENPALSDPNLNPTSTLLPSLSKNPSSSCLKTCFCPNRVSTPTLSCRRSVSPKGKGRLQIPNGVFSE
jgi:hypothetical protein